MSRDNFDPTKTPGTFGEPPPNAPREVSQPLAQDAIGKALSEAAKNEQPLPPFDPPKRMGVLPPETLHAAPRSAPPSHQPAASETDSPSRGIPQEITDPGKRITGGFGHAGESQYFPLDGSELRELVRSLMDKINERIQDDLRFHIAITYPRVRARVVVEIEAYAQDSGFEIEKISEWTKTPLEYARVIADKVAFVVIEGRQEMADDGSAENPPNRVRDELGLPTPHKQQIQTPGGRIFVDVPNPGLDNLF